MKRILIACMTIVCLLACGEAWNSSDMSKEEARAVMDDVSRRNLAYEPLTERDDTLMQRVVAYCLEHGTANEQMEAYYLLGSVYRDLHEAPRALDAFLDGINAADTTSKECKYSLLARLYGQMSDILRKQSLHRQSAEAGKKVYRYAALAGDTLLMVASQWGRFGEYFAFGNYQAIADECWDVLEESKRLGLLSYGASWLCTSVLANMEIGRVEEAQNLLAIYERHSGKVNMDTRECSFPIYYYAKGRVLAATGRLDSAEYFFRKELEKAVDWNNRQAAYRGLRMTFEQKRELDSVGKYASLQCDAVDSSYQEKLSLALQNQHEMYNYSRIQTENSRKELQLWQTRRRLFIICVALAFVVICAIYIIIYIRARYRLQITDTELKLERATAELEELENKVHALRDKLAQTRDEKEKQRLQEEVEKAEKEMEEQRTAVMDDQKRLDDLRQRVKSNSKMLRKRYSTTPLFQTLLHKARSQDIATEQDYEKIRQALLKVDADLLHRFYELLPDSSETEVHVFLLLRFGMTKTEVSQLIAHSQSAVTNTCNRLFCKVNGRQCSTSAEAYEWLLRL